MKPTDELKPIEEMTCDEVNREIAERMGFEAREIVLFMGSYYLLWKGDRRYSAYYQGSPDDCFKHDVPNFTADANTELPLGEEWYWTFCESIDHKWRAWIGKGDEAYGNESLTLAEARARVWLAWKRGQE